MRSMQQASTKVFYQCPCFRRKGADKRNVLGLLKKIYETKRKTFSSGI